MLSSELEELRRVFETEKPFHDWPATFEHAITSPLVLALLRTYARHPDAMRSRRVLEVQMPIQSQPPRFTDYQRIGRGIALGVDRKRLAANDRDD